MAGDPRRTRKSAKSTVALVAGIVLAASTIALAVPLATEGLDAKTRAQEPTEGASVMGWEALEQVPFDEWPLLALAAYAFDVPSEDQGQLADGLDALDSLPPTYAATTKATLLQMAKARAAQGQALAGLSPAEYHALMGGDPDAGAWHKVDGLHLEEAMRSAADLVTYVDNLKRLQGGGPHSLAGALQAEGHGPFPQGAGAEAISPQAREAFGASIEGQAPSIQAILAPLAAALPETTDASSMQRFVDALDNARLGLQTIAAVESVGRGLAGAPPSWSPYDSSLSVPWISDAGHAPEPRPLEDAFADLAQELGLPAEVLSAQDQVLVPAELSGPLASLADATTRYLSVARDHAAQPQPDWGQSMTDAAWLHYRSGTVPDPYSAEAEAIRDAAAYFQSQVRLDEAKADIMAALNSILAAAGSLSMNSSTATVPGCTEPACDELADEISSLEEGTQDETEALADAISEAHSILGDECQASLGELHLPPLVSVDFCGKDSLWDTDVVLTVDLGGDDVYDRQAGAPFSPAPIDVGQDSFQPPEIPVSIVLDIGGSDTYDASGLPCAQGAACLDFEEAVFPFGILVDWDTDEAEAHNVFRGGSHSQGAGAGILVERAGRDSTIRSEYVASSYSQGSIAAAGVPTSIAGGLLRLVGPHSTSEATFEAGSHSQAFVGSLDGQGAAASRAFFINSAGPGSSANDVYEAGMWSQGSASYGNGTVALFMDLIGENGTSNDQYNAGDHSRGFTASHRGYATPTIASRGAKAWLPTELEGGVFVDAALAAPQPGANQGTGPEPEARVPLTPAWTISTTSDDRYDGALYGTGHGSGIFLDWLGSDAYASQEPAGPRNHALWRPVQEAFIEAEPGPADADCLQPPGIPACGFDLSPRDDDQDGTIQAMELLWREIVGLWDAGDDDPRRSPSPIGPAILIDAQGRQMEDEDLNRTYAIALNLRGTDDEYGPGFAANLHIDAAGNDVYRGRTGASALGSDDGDELFPHHVHGLAASIDLGGDDRYLTDFPQSQGFGARGIGMLVDYGGSDRYIAPQESQGHGGAGGVGVLADLAVPGNDDRNVFVQGGQQAGDADGVGIRIANGAHNTYHDGVLTPADGGRLSVNLGDNGAPEITGGPVANGVGLQDGLTLPVAVTHSFSAEVRDPEGDGMRLCWSFEYWDAELDAFDWFETCEEHLGTGVAEDVMSMAAFTWNETYQVPTNRSSDDHSEAYPLRIQFTAVDTGNATVDVTRTPDIENPPPVISAPDTPPVQRGDFAGFQPSMEFAPDLDGMELDVAIDGIRQEPSCWNANAQDAECIDWADGRLGAALRLPESAPSATSPEDLAKAIDGDGETSFALPINAGDAANLVLAWETSKNIRALRMDFSQFSSAPLSFSFTGVKPDGTAAFLGVASGQAATDGRSSLLLDLPPDSALAGFESILIRELRDQPRQDPSSLEIHEIRALGPGFARVWEAPGTHVVTFRLVDSYGGRAAVEFLVTVVSGSPPSIDLVDFADRGPATHVTLAHAAGAREPYTLTLDAPADTELCVTWAEDEEPDCEDGGEGVQFTHAWEDPGDYLVAASIDGGEPKPIAWAHVETALDLTIRQEGAVVPLAFISLESMERSSWHQPIGGVPYAAIIDASGADRYLGPVAVARSPADIGQNQGGVPGFVIDAAGDDDYLSRTAKTQAFGTAGAVAMLADLDGNDLYVAPAEAQGAAIVGMALLIDRNGDDVFLAASPDDVGGGSVFPDSLSSATSRPLGLVENASRFTESTGRFVQGAAREGLALFSVTGGHDAFIAESEAQGYAEHHPGADQPFAYASPHPECVPGAGGVPLAQACDPVSCEPDDDGDITDPYCFLGIALSVDETSGCTASGASPVTTCDRGSNEMVRGGPRYGPSVAAVHRIDGTATFNLVDKGQAMARSNARAGWLASGPFVAQAGDASQGFTEDGLAVVSAPGVHAAWLGGSGQGHATSATDHPEGHSAGAAHYEGSPTYGYCGGPCGDPSGGSPTPEAVVAWNSPTFVTQQSQLTAELRNLDTAAIEVVVLAQPVKAPASLLAGLLADGQGACDGLPPAGPALKVAQMQIQPGASAPVPLDIENLRDGAALTAGCNKLLAFARPLSLSAPTAWTVSDADLLGLPAPVPRLVREDGTALQRLVLAGPADVRLRFTDPGLNGALDDGEADVGLKLGLTHPDGATTLGFTAKPSGSTEADGWHRDMTFNITPPSVPDGTSQGGYVLCSQFSARIDDTDLFDDGCRPFAELVVDRGAPQIELQSMDAGAFWKLTDPFSATINIVDGSGIGSAEVRLVRTGCSADCAIQLRQGPDSSGEEIEWTNGSCEWTNGSCEWRVEIQPEDVQFPGGPVDLQAKASDASGATTPWTTLKTFVLDGAAPGIASDDPQGVASNAAHPIHLNVTYHDCAAPSPDCETGSGLDAATVSAFIRQIGRDDVEPLDIVDVHPDSIQLRWNSTEAAPGAASEGSTQRPGEGFYEILLSAEDHVGNLHIENPGLPVVIDRSPPVIQRSAQDGDPGPTIELPQGQTWVKPGDEIQVSARIIDGHGAASSGIADAQAFITTSAAETVVDLTVDPAAPDIYSGTIVVPGTQDDVIEVEVVATDRASNSVHEASGPIRLQAVDPTIEVLDTLLGTHAIHVTLRTGHEADVVLAQATHGPVTVDANVVQLDSSTHRLEFSGLAAQTSYDVTVEVIDRAGREVELSVLALTTAADLQPQVVLKSLPAITYGGDVTVRGQIVQWPAGHAQISVHAITAQGDRVVEVMDVEAIDGDNIPIDLTVNTTSAFPASTSMAIEGTIRVEIRNELTTESGEVSLRVDNAPPAAEIFIDGDGPNEGWFNRSVEVVATFQEDTAPVNATAFIAAAAAPESALSQAGDRVRITRDGAHLVHFVLQDGAVPANSMTTPTVLVNVDRTAPALVASLAENVTRNESVALRMEASDPAPGTGAVASYRASIGPATPWSETPPPTLAVAHLGEGAHTVIVEARDLAGNVAREQRTLIIDRTAPEILAAEWAGRSASGHPALTIIARDATTHVSALRMDTPSGWTDWLLADGLSVVEVEHADATTPRTLQVRDAAGNVNETRVAGLEASGPDDTTGETPLREPNITPEAGDTATNFVVTVVVSERNGSLPEHVWAVIDGHRTEMKTLGPPLQGGLQMYGVSRTLPPTDLDRATTMRVEAEYADATVAIDVPVQAFVAKAAGVPDTPAGDRDAGAPQALLALLGSLAFILYRRRRA